ncbi:MAG: DUF4231 domain-containing protein [Anaerolineaceae bacterium]|nr:DUF4231 domain-containing protein [Anaerolineaceae bacterium]
MTQKSASGAVSRTTRKWYDDLFFNRRRPHLRALPMEWEKPEDDDAYQKLIHDDDFISPKYFEDGDLRQHPMIMRDAEDLAEYLLPTYFEYSQKSKYYQDRFYFYQWIFVFGAFLTTVAGSIATLLYIPPGLSPAAAQLAERSQDLNNVNWQQVFSIITAAIGAVTAFFTAVSNRGEPQKRWGKTRRLAEELRMHYFTYLSHLPPYDTPERLKIMRRNVVDIRVKEQQNV